MSTQDTKTATDLHGDDPETRRVAASLMGKARTERKLSTLAENRARVSDPDVKQKMQAAQQARRERERSEKASAVVSSEPNKPAGRPRKEQPENPEPKRPRGRPKKENASND